MKLKGMALDWLRSNFNDMKISSDDLLKGLRDMFHESLSKSELRRKFENRIGQRNKIFQDYPHAKMILANPILIDEKEMIEFHHRRHSNRKLEAGIANYTLKAVLHKAFGKVSLEGKILHST